MAQCAQPKSCDKSIGLVILKDLINLYISKLCTTFINQFIYLFYFFNCPNLKCNAQLKKPLRASK